jgi:tetratricopeptide (TPR) repeat protein
VTSSSLFRRFVAGTAFAALIAVNSASAAAQTSGGVPSSLDLAGLTASGSYLAARHAGQQRDALAAAAYYRAALRKDPKNGELLNRAFLSLLVGGDIDDAVKLAERVVKIDKTDRVAHLVLSVHALKQRQYATARRDLAQSVRGPITDLAATLLTAWSYAGSGDTKAAIATIDRLTGPDWYAIFKDLHAGMILEQAGKQDEAGKRFERAHKLDSSALRVVEAYGGWLSRNGKSDEALKVFTEFNKVLPNHPLVKQSIELLTRKAVAAPAAPAVEAPADLPLDVGANGDVVKKVQAKLGIKADGIFGRHMKAAVRKFQEQHQLTADGVVDAKTFAKMFAGAAARTAAVKLPRLAMTAPAGGAEALYGLGASLGRRGGEDLGLVYLQLSLHLVPNHSLALLSLADLYESLKKPEMAIKIYERIPATSPLHRNAAIQMAADLDALGRGDEAEKQLNAIIQGDPKDLEAIMALGNVLRGHKKFAQCADVYSKGFDIVGKPTKANWVMFYFRGICYERSKQWPKAEADLKQALELFPDQPHVLNYLGYSWIDQGINLDQGMAMIKKAVQQRPDDGYIVDSLGWAYYRLGNYEDAVKQLDRAIELKPDDPTINDHLGDAYWRVGRRLEAKFQWAHARDLKPESEELPKILQKLKDGLPDDTTSTAKASDKPVAKSGNGG